MPSHYTISTPQQAPFTPSYEQYHRIWIRPLIPGRRHLSSPGTTTLAGVQKLSRAGFTCSLLLLLSLIGYRFFFRREDQEWGSVNGRKSRKCGSLSGGKVIKISDEDCLDQSYWCYFQLLWRMATSAHDSASSGELFSGTADDGCASPGGCHFVSLTKRGLFIGWDNCILTIKGSDLHFSSLIRTPTSFTLIHFIYREISHHSLPFLNDNALGMCYGFGEC